MKVYAKEVLGDGEVTDRRGDSTPVGTIQRRLWGGGMETYLFTTLAIINHHASSATPPYPAPHHMRNSVPRLHPDLLQTQC